MTGPVTQPWTWNLPFAMQSVLLLAGRFADGARKNHPLKPIVRGYRAHVLVAAAYGRPLERTDIGDDFMEWPAWDRIEQIRIPHVVDDLPHHYLMHLVHGVEILGYKYPDPGQAIQWRLLYGRFASSFHMRPETEEALDLRLGHWHLAASQV